MFAVLIFEYKLSIFGNNNLKNQTGISRKQDNIFVQYFDDFYKKDLTKIGIYAKTVARDVCSSHVTSLDLCYLKLQSLPSPFTRQESP